MEDQPKHKDYREKLQELLEKAKAKLIWLGRELWAFLSSPVFLKNLGLMVGAALLLLFLTSRWLHCYTRHGESYPVPDFAGLSLDEAEEAAADNHMELVVRDSIWVENQPGGIVLEQEPEPTSLVKRNRKIYVRISRSNPDETVLPPLTGSYDFNQYSRKLAQRHLKLEVKERVYHPQYAENTILYLFYQGQKITENDLKKKQIKIPKGSTVYAVVTRRTADFVNAPDLICSTLSEAKFMLSAANLTLGEAIEDPSVSEPETAVVWKQDPPANTRMKPGNVVKVYLTGQAPAGCE